MIGLYFVLALVLVLVGHAFRLLRWEQFIRIYERPLRGQMLRGMAGGYALNFVLPFHLGDVFRAVFPGRRMKSGVGFALATVIMDRFLDVWFVALGFIAFRCWGREGPPCAVQRGTIWCSRWCWRQRWCWCRCCVTG
ncbi:MAG: lysylphosphatidylglycerol synthase domain-containing protein [Gemmiger sp.]